MPEPLPITAPCFAFGTCASVMSGSRICVDSSPSRRRGVVVSVIGSNQTGASDASGLPLVASEYPPSSALRTLTVAVRPSL